ALQSRQVLAVCPAHGKFHEWSCQPRKARGIPPIPQHPPRTPRVHGFPLIGGLHGEGPTRRPHDTSTTTAISPNHAGTFYFNPRRYRFRADRYESSCAIAHRTLASL